MADTKLSAVTEDTAPSTDDLIYLVNDPGGTPTSRRSTVSNFLNTVHGNVNTNAEVGSFTFALTDAGKVTTISNASATTATIPPNSSVAFPTGTILILCQIGVGACTWTQGAGVTINISSNLTAVTNGQYSYSYARKTATDTWEVWGDLVPSNSGDTLVIFTPHANEPPASNFATLDTRNAHPVLDFDDTTNESAVFSGAMPQNYAGTGVTVYVGYSMTSATTGDVDIDVAFERIGDQQLDVDADSFATAQSVDNTTVPGTSGNVDVVSVAFTDGAQMDSVAAGELFRLKVTRDAASDTATGDMELHFVEIRAT